MRRGAYAVEFALLLPVLLILASGVIDVGQQLIAADALAAAVADGARAGALADVDDGEDPIATAQAVAVRNFNASNIPVTPTFTGSYEAAAPDVRLVLTGTASVTPYFGFVTLPTSIAYTSTIRLSYQP